MKHAWWIACAALACGPTVVRDGQKVKLVPTGDLARLAEAAKGHKCSITGENLSGRGDADACGPFPCDAGECRVATCGGDDRLCHPGFCFEGFCVRAAEQGARSCEPFAWPKEEDETKSDWAKWSGCECVPQSESRGRDERSCGSFPCSADGCYVKACNVDKDCAHGMCSSHASGPHGYCVTDDPI